MNMLNQVILIGRLTSDPELKEVGESKVVNITIANQRSYKNKDGNTVYTNDCAVESIEFCESKNSQQNGDGEVNNHAPQTNSGDKWMTIPDDVSDSGLPF